LTEPTTPSSVAKTGVPFGAMSIPVETAVLLRRHPDARVAEEAAHRCWWWNGLTGQP
jgi:hypothetical protein